MAKISDLNLGDSGPAPGDQLARTRQRADRFLAQLEDLIDDPRYEFCWGMLVDMRVTVARAGQVTAAQEQAIRNVIAGAQRHDEQREGWERHERRTGRRYEGWTGGQD